MCRHVRLRVYRHARLRVAYAAAAVAATFFLALKPAQAQVVFQDNFDAGTSGANWTTNRSSTDSFANYAFDYSTLGIPSAPGSPGGSTIGMAFQVNPSAGIFQGISASPTGQSFTGDFNIEFDLWINFPGPFPAGGSGSTQAATMGWGTNGTTAQWAGGNDSVMFAGTGDGGSAQDYRAYRNTGPSGGAPLAPSTGVYAAGTTTSPDARNASHAYYSSLGGETAPAAQQALFPEQTGTTAVGTLGMAWRDVLIRKSGNDVSWTVDGLLIATVPIDGVTLGGTNIFFGMFDVNTTSSSANDALNTAIFDNITVTAVPEPGTMTLMGLGLAGLAAARRRKKRENHSSASPLEEE